MCPKVENVILGCGIFGIIISTLAIGTCLVGYVYEVWCIAVDEHSRSDKHIYTLAGILTVLLNISVISLVFSILLVKGIKKKNPRLLRMYFLYGCLMNLLSAVGVTLYAVWFQTGALLIAIVLPICAIYSVILASVLKTQLKYQRNVKDNIKYQIVNNQFLILERT